MNKCHYLFLQFTAFISPNKKKRDRPSYKNLDQQKKFAETFFLPQFTLKIEMVNKK